MARHFSGTSFTIGAMSLTCFHCGLPCTGNTYPIQYQNRTEPACCAGCQAVAQTIIDSGLDGYYRHRTADARRSEPLPAELLEQMRLFDDDALQTGFVHVEDGQIREAALLLEGITCAACTWLIEQHLKRLPGLLSVDINYSTLRARVRWDNATLHLSAILAAVSTIGYSAHPYDDAKREALAERERKRMLNRLWVAGLSMMQVMMYAVPVYLAGPDGIDDDFLWLLHWASMLLTLPVMLYSAQPFYRGFLRDMRLRRVGMDTPVTLAVVISFIASLWALLQHVGHGIYFDSVSMFVFLLLGGRYLEGLARRKAGAATESLIKLTPAFAHRVNNWPTDRDAHEAAVSQLQTADVVLVKAGETLPADGQVIDGDSAVDEALLTGESLPQRKTPGDTVIAGSVNRDGPLYIQITQIGQNTRLAGIVRLLDAALAQKPRLAQLADRAAGWFVALLLLCALATYIGWRLAGQPEQALWHAVAVLIVSCPCALSLATPAALTAAAGNLAGRGVLVARGHALETLAHISDAIFDKTGTLSNGQLALHATLQLAQMTSDDALRLVQALERDSEHVIARAFGRGDNLPQAESLRNIPGHGVEGLVDRQRWRLGSIDFVEQLAGPCPTTDWQTNNTLIGLGGKHGWVALFALADSLRDDAAAMLAQLRRAGITTHLLSGDQPGAVAEVAQTLHIDHWQARATPEDKLAYVSALQQQGRRVLMVGDGINDAPVLARADVSIAMGCGTDVARYSGDMVLINNQLTQVTAAWRVARSTLHIIRENLGWAAAYNLAALPLAAAGYITPWLASLGMACSSLLVVGNALRLTKR